MIGIEKAERKGVPSCVILKYWERGSYHSLTSTVESLQSKSSPKLRHNFDFEGEGESVFTPRIFADEINEKMLPPEAQPSTKRGIPNSDYCSSSVVDG